MARAAMKTPEWPTTRGTSDRLAPDPDSRATEGHVALTVVNRSAQPLTGLHIVGALTPGWGKDWLGGVALGPGETARFEWPHRGGAHHLRAFGVDRQALGYRSLRPEPGSAWIWEFVGPVSPSRRSS